MVTLEVTVGIDIDGMGSVVVNTFGKSVDAFAFDVHEVVSRDADHRGEGFASISCMEENFKCYFFFLHKYHISNDTPYGMGFGFGGSKQ